MAVENLKAGAPFRWNRGEWPDAALAAGAIILNASVLLTIPTWSPGAAAWVLVVAHSAPVGFRRRAPRAAFAVSSVAGGAYLLLGWPMVGLGLTALVMTYSLSAYAARRDSLVGVAAVGSMLVLVVAFGPVNQQASTLGGNLAMLAAAWILGASAHRRRDDAFAEQGRLAREAVAGERLRIARELHDVVAHSMSVIAVQAGTGRVVIDDDVEHARRALRSIEESAKQALDEMRRLLGVLRSESDEPPARAPVPTLADVDRLVAHAVEGGTPVDVRVDGHRRPVPAGIELTAYRVLQEALTNVRRHAPGAPARVRVGFEPDELVVEVENGLPGGGPGGPPGHGLMGMRERVSLYGGALDAGPRPDGTFRVRARLPYETGRR